ncbi:MAG: hypothetical protein ACTSSF_08725, partial [Candidatus Heimdallarchaeaceae archaeon]
MRKIFFLFFFILIIPIPLTQGIVNSLIREDLHENSDGFVLQEGNVQTVVRESKIIHITKISQAKKEQVVSEETANPKLAPATYPTFTTSSGNGSTIQRGEEIQSSALTEFELISKVPVDQGSHYWYDLEEIQSDSGEEIAIITADTIATAFSLSVSLNIMAFSFNLSEVTDTISSELQFYLTDNLSDFQNTYLMKYDLSYNTYNFHRNNPSSPLLFVFFDHPLSTQISNTLESEKTYYAVLSSSNSFSLQTTTDNSEKDDYQVYVNSGTWVEQIGVDIQFSIYAGSLLQVENVGTDGSSAIIYDSKETTGRIHYLTTSFYDSSNTYDGSADFIKLNIIDSTAPEYLTLSCPPSAEYTDSIILYAKVENLFHQPLEGVNVSFYISDDNDTWNTLVTKITDIDGYAIVNYGITEASGYKYFKSIVNTLAAYNLVEQRKETVFVTLPVVYSVYGGAIGFTDLAEYVLKAKIEDNDGTPFSGLAVNFQIQGYTDITTIVTNSSGWATTPQGFLDWNVGEYINAFWVSISLDTSFYNYAPTSYGNIVIEPNILKIVNVLDSLENIWNDPLNLSFQITDDENDLIPNLSYETIIHDER